MSSVSTKKKVLLFGPVIGEFAGAYGGGTGGYTRNMSQYLLHFRADNFEIVPCFHTVAGQGKIKSFLLRFCIDLFRFFKSMVVVRPDIVHILAQYRTATPREFAVSLLCRMIGTPVIYEVKAGTFSTWIQSSNPVFRKMARFCIRQADTVLCEGKPTLAAVQKATGVTGVFFPNFVSVEEIPAQVPEKLKEPLMKILFVGYAFREKGVFELVEGCNQAAEEIPLELNLIGQEHPEFTAWIDVLKVNEKLKINRIGRQPHEVVMENFGKNDIYCYPTRHPGEGHNNSINEAMMHGMVIITARQGFLESVLEDTCYFLSEVSAAEVTTALFHIAAHREEAREKSRKTRQRLMENFTDKLAFEKLQMAYQRAVNKN